MSKSHAKRGRKLNFCRRQIITLMLALFRIGASIRETVEPISQETRQLSVFKSCFLQNLVYIIKIETLGSVEIHRMRISQKLNTMEFSFIFFQQ